MLAQEVRQTKRRSIGMTARAGVAMAVVLLGLSGVASVEANRSADTYSLRGGAVPAGLKLEETAKFDLNNMQMTLDMGPQKQTITMDVSVDRKIETEITDATDRDVTGVLVTIDKQTSDMSMNAGGQNQKQQEKSKLVGKTLKGTKSEDGTWTFEAARGSLNDEEKAELDQLDGFDQFDELLPEEAVEVGHTWSTKGAELEELLKSMGGQGVEGIKSVKGEAKGKFVKIEQVDGVDCAVIEVDLDLTADAEFQGQAAEIKIDASLEFTRRLDYGINLDSDTSGKLSIEANVNEGGQKMSMKMAGPIKMQSKTKVTEPK